MSFVGLLTILFIGLKLTGFIDWSWWLVLMPVWTAPILAMVFIIGLAIVRKR